MANNRKPSIELLEDGFEERSIFVKGYKPCKDLKAIVKVRGFQPDVEKFGIKVVAEFGPKSDKGIIKKTGAKKKADEDGTYIIKFDIDNNCKGLESNKSRIFKAITNQNQMADAHKELTDFKYFGKGDIIEKIDFLKITQSIVLSETQGVEALRKDAAGRNEGEKLRKLTGAEENSIYTHFFGDSDVIHKDDENYSKFREWLHKTVDVLGVSPYKEFYANGLIFVHLDEAGINIVLGDNDKGDFMFMCGIKDPGTIGIVEKGEDGRMKKRPLYMCSKIPYIVATDIKRIEGLKKMAKLDLDDGSSVELHDKSKAMEELLSKDGLSGSEDFPGTPIYV